MRVRVTIRRFVTAAVTLMMAAAMSLSFCSCNFVEGIRDRFDKNKDLMSREELARVIVNAVISQENVADAYSIIPDSQLDGISYTSFYQYCSILRTMSDRHGTVSSFKILTNEEKNKFFDRVDSRGSDNEDNGKRMASIKSYADLTLVELCYNKDDKPGNPCRFALTSNGGTYKMASDYINDSLQSYNYLDHYFNMIEKGNTAGLEAILKPTLTSDIYIDSVVTAKAEFLIDYYASRVRSLQHDFRLKTFLPTVITFEIPETVDNTGNRMVNDREVKLYRGENGSFYIDDKFDMTGEEISLNFSNANNAQAANALGCGSSYTSKEINDMFGEPIMTTVRMNGDKRSTIILSYNGMTLHLEGNGKSDGTWTSGELTAISIYSYGATPVECNLGGNLYIGMNISELLLVFPMIDETSYVYTFETLGMIYEISFTFDENNNVVGIRMSEKGNAQKADSTVQPA